MKFKIWHNSSSIANAVNLGYKIRMPSPLFYMFSRKNIFYNTISTQVLHIHGLLKSKLKCKRSDLYLFCTLSAISFHCAAHLQCRFCTYFAYSTRLAALSTFNSVSRTQTRTHTHTLAGKFWSRFERWNLQLLPAHALIKSASTSAARLSK